MLLSFLKKTWFSLLIAIIPSGLFLAPLPHSSIVYYTSLIFLGGLFAFRSEKVNIIPIIFLLICAFSILFGKISPFFKPWARLGLFSLLLMAYFPVFQSKFSEKIRVKTFLIMLIIIIFTSIGSFIGYFLGINYMEVGLPTYSEGGQSINTAGWFGGLTYQSMLLGPICALSLTVLVWIILEKTHSKKEKLLLICAAFSCLCCMMLTASRVATIAGIVGALIVLFMKFRRHITKMVRIGTILLVLAWTLYPIYMPYADKVLSKQQKNVESGSMFASRETYWIHRLEEFTECPIFGYGFCGVDTKNYGEYSSTGTIEPGSSWLAILSMTGILGAGYFLCLFGTTISKLYRIFCFQHKSWALLHIGIIAVFAIHFIAEGYIFSAGGPLCFLFWFFFGCAYSYAKNPLIEYKLMS